MPLTLSSSQSSILEPLRKNRWVMQFTSVPGVSDVASATNLAFCAHTAQRPTQTYNVTELQRLNERFYVAGKVTWSELPMTFFDYINGANSASEILWNWSKMIYNPVTGQMGFKKQYTTSGTLAMLDPAGGIVQVWNLFYVWPFTLNWGELSADDDGLSEVSVTFRYDYAVKGTDVNTTPA
jgi:hypothetical protein